MKTKSFKLCSWYSDLLLSDYKAHIPFVNLCHISGRWDLLSVEEGGKRGLPHVVLWNQDKGFLVYDQEREFQGIYPEQVIIIVKAGARP